MIYTFEIPGPSCPQGSSRAFVVKGKAVITSASKGLAQWRSHAIQCIHAQIGSQGLSEPLSGPLGVEVRDERTRPSSRSKKAVWADRQPDLDKIARAVLDALEAAGVFKNDAQVCALHTDKIYAERAKVIVRVWSLPQ